MSTEIEHSGRLTRFLRSSFTEKLNVLAFCFYRVKGAFYYRRIFATFGKGSVLFKPLLLNNTQYMHLGDNVTIRPGARLEAVVSDRAALPELRIGDNVNIEQNVHIVCHSRISIGNNVSITGHCAIVDVTHPYEDVNDPTKIGARISKERSFVEIGEGSFLGLRSIVLPNVKIGKHCVIGANSTVTRDIPDYCVVAGNPARIVRFYDWDMKQWRRPVEN